jgi:galactofuranose transport system permease protein
MKPSLENFQSAKLNSPAVHRRSAGRNPEVWRKLRWPLTALAVLLVLNLAFTPGFFKIAVRDGRLYGSLIDILNRAAPVMLLSTGMTFVIATGGVDLSVGAIMAVAGSLAALLLTQAHLPFGVLILVSLGVALALGLSSGLLVAFLDVQPIVATLILMVAGRGTAQLLTGGQIITFDHPSFNFLAGGHFAALPFTVTIVAGVVLAAGRLVNRTSLRLFIEATGNNEVASRFSGVHTRMVKLFVYGFSGLCAGVAGLIVASDIKAADANNAGLYLELDAILAVVIGGTSLRGGRFYLFNSLAGATLLQTLTTTILTRGIPPEFTLVVKALVIIAVCLLQSDLFRKKAVRLWERPALR